MIDLTLAGLAAAIAARRLSPVEVTRACLDRIARLDGRLRTFITLDAEGALRTAREREAELAAGRLRGPLHGVPLAYKDLCVVPGLPTSCGTRVRDYFPGRHACTAVARLAAAGAITLGKLNMTELALGPFGDNAHHGDVDNPWRAGHVAGGSSSGSAAAVAAGLVPGALGSDTGGSVRLPAACCGVVGLKPTHGRVSRAGVMPLAWSLDTLGPLARTVEDAALLLEVIAGHDPLDATSSRRPTAAWRQALARPIAGLRVGLPAAHAVEDADAETRAALDAVARRLQGMGARIEAVSLPDPGPMTDACHVILRCESAAVHARFVRERPHDLQPAVRARLEVGQGVAAVDYLQALRVRAHATRAFLAEVFARVDALLLPVVPEPAPLLAAVTAGPAGEVVCRMARFSRFTRPWNGYGLPALAVPSGLSADGRPLGLQVIGRPFDETTVLRVGHACERAAGWPRRPPLD